MLRAMPRSPRSRLPWTPRSAAPWITTAPIFSPLKNTRAPGSNSRCAPLSVRLPSRAKAWRKARSIFDNVIEGDLGFGLLDGMVYGPVDGKTRVVVTTESMFQRWLNQHKDWWGKDFANIPQEPSAAVKEDTFYTQAVLTDSAVVRFAELPIHPPAGAAFAFAMLAARTQSEVPPKADEIFVAVAQGGRVFIAQTKEVSAVGPIASCDAIRGILVKKSFEAGEELIG